MVNLLLVLLAASSIVSSARGLPSTKRQAGRKNVILGWYDGMGPSVLPLARQYVQMLENSDVPTYNGYVTSLEKDLIGKSRTGSASSLITDSAAGAVAVASGFKTDNRKIGVDPDVTPLGTILEAAKAAGYMTGVISTSYIWDASPAAFNSHSESRDDAWFIAQQQIGLDHPLGHTTDLILGGGLCAFIPQSETDSCRPDDRNLLTEAQASGVNWTVVLTPSDLASASSLPLIGLFSPTDIAYAIDRNTSIQPSLPDMVGKALELLYEATADSDQGFFLFYESEVTDSAQHDNDVIGTLSGALEISDAAVVVKEWVGRLNERGDDTLFVSTSDHETGGFGLGTNEASPVRRPWGWDPLVLANASHSALFTADVIAKAASEGTLTLEQVTEIVASNLNLAEFSAIEAQAILDEGNDTGDILDILVAAVNRRAGVNWTTGGHTATDVDVFCFENEYCLNFRGSHENTELAWLLEGFFGDIDLDAITEQLVASGFNATAPDI